MTTTVVYGNCCSVGVCKKSHQGSLQFVKKKKKTEQFLSQPSQGTNAKSLRMKLGILSSKQQLKPFLVKSTFRALLMNSTMAIFESLAEALCLQKWHFSITVWCTGLLFLATTIPYMPGKREPEKECWKERPHIRWKVSGTEA